MPDRKMIQPSKGLQEISRNCSTVVDVLRYRSATQPDACAFTFLEDGGEYGMTYREVDCRSRAIAARLQALGYTGERALLLYPPGLDYLTAFFGCLYAGVVAVPAYPPRNQRNTPRIQAIVADAQASLALTTTAILPTVKSLLAQQTERESLPWLATDSLEEGIEDFWQQPSIHPETLAFLQYTSGSTGTPKGVMLSHGNLLHNAATTYQFMGHSPNSTFVSWLPIYHDMGLIGGIWQPLYGGFPCILMPPATFLQRPYRWLQAISHYKGTTSGAPNFAYELCLQKITPEQRSSLDLSSWSVAFNGAEPIRKDTLEQFAAAFASCGFRKEAFYPCYGMAEATLMISGSQTATAPQLITVQKAALENNQVVEVDTSVRQAIATAEAGAEPLPKQSVLLVGCGRTIPEQQIVIAHPETLTRCPPDRVGEIWVSGPSIGQGYWNRPVETEQTFHAYLSDTGEGPFLRTGDLGFLHAGELFVTGRVKDLIIVRGRNLYPQDIEHAAERSHSALRAGSGAAFAIEVDDREQLVVVQELEFRAKPDLEEAIAAIRQAVAQEHEVQVYAVVLIKPGSIPKTSSGKIQRRACKAEFLADKLQVVSKSIFNHSSVEDETSLVGTSNFVVPENETALISYLQQLVAQAIKVASSQVQPQQPLTNLGIDSLMAFELKNRLELDFGVAISVADLLQDASIIDLSRQILARKTATTAPQPELKPVPRNGYLPLCLAQERLWFLEQLEPGNPFYNVAIAVQLKGKLNITALQQSLKAIVQRHESLRTSFKVVEGKPVQAIHPMVDVSLPIVDFTSVQDPPSEIQHFILKETQQPFDLSQAPLLRAQLLCLQENEYLLLVTMHHIISDGWSIGVLLQELAAVYQACDRGQPSPLAELPIQYADFAYWQRQLLPGEVLKQLDYWKQQLSGSIPVLQLPTDRTRPAIQTFTGKKQSLALPKNLAEAVKELNQREGVTLFMTLLTVFKILLYCYTKQEDILVGSPVAGRNRPETQGSIGFFINTLVLRTNLSKNPTFRELLQRVREVALGAYAHQDVPFEKLVEELQPERNLSYNPLFQVMFILQNAPIPSVELSGLTWQPQEVDSGTAKFDLKLSLWETSEGLNGSFEYKTDLFDAPTITRMARDFEILLSQISIHPEIKLKELAAILAEADKEQQRVQEKELEAISSQKLKLTKRKVIGNYKRQAVSGSIQTALLMPDSQLPLSIQASVEGVNLVAWAANNRESIATYLLQHGGILFRNFQVKDVVEFEQFIQTISGELLEYRDRSSPRSPVQGNIYTSTDYPANQRIFLHSENSYAATYPLKLFFYCIVPAQQGGETPIADTRKLYQRIDPQIRDRFAEKQVMYVRNFGDGFGLPWQTVFQTTQPADVEAFCQSNGIEFEWKGNKLRTCQVRPAIAKHPYTGELVWFNHAAFFHISTLAANIREALLAEFSEAELPHNTYYGDGSSIEPEVLDEIRASYQQETVIFPWQTGDILMLDNMLTAHGRQPFLGNRKVVVGMAEPFNKS